MNIPSRAIRMAASWNAALALSAALLLGGCSFEKLAADNMAPVFAKTKDDFNRVTVPRYAREAGPSLLATLNGFVLASPDNVDLRLLQAEMNATFAFAFLEVEQPEWAGLHYRLAQQAALAALADEDEDLAMSLPELDAAALTKRLAEVDEDALPALFWWGFARGSEINLRRGEPGQVAGLTSVDTVMDWVLEREETYFNGGPHLYFAMRHLALPASLGGDPAKGLEHFQAVERLTSGKLLLAQVLCAQYHAPSLAATRAGADIDQVLSAQRAAWDAWFGALDAVVKAPDDLWPAQALSNAVAKQRARALLADPESNNIIPPPDVSNPYAQAAPAGGDWGGGEGAGGDWGGEGDGDWGAGDGDGDWGAAGGDR